MPILQTFCEWLENTAPAQFVAGSTWAFPTIETVHVLVLVIVVGSIAIVDLRLLGVASNNRKVTALSNDVLPITWGAFAMALITGGLLFSSKASHYLENWPFRLKMALLLAAGINMLLFHAITWKGVGTWDDLKVTPRSARVAGALSLVFWVGVVVFGRWIGFTVR